MKLNVQLVGLDQQACEASMLNDKDLERYARQVIMPAVGEEGQEKAAGGTGPVVGAGGLGAPVTFISCCCWYRHNNDYR